MIDVDGHKDRLVPFQSLSPHEKLNCLADTAAKSLLRWVLEQDQPGEVPNHIYGEGIRVTMMNTMRQQPKKITGNPTNTLSQTIFWNAMARELRELDEKGILEQEDFHLVNWEAMGKALESRSPQFCTWVTKHVSGQCGVGSKMFKWKYWDTSNCPCCDEPNETTLHLSKCNSEHMLTAFAAQTLKFLDWLEEANTSPDIIAYFTTVLQQHDCPEDGTNFPNHMALACTAQGYIGWDNLMFGRVATEWQNLQHQHYRSISSRRSADRWAADITYRLLQFSHALWMARNRFLHERDEQGLLLAEGQNLTDAITQSYLRG